MPLEKMPDGPAFEQRYEARFHQHVQLNAPFAYDAVYIIADAMKRAHSTRAADILAAMPASDFVGVLGRTQFDARGDLKQGAISLYDYKSGKQTLLTVVKM
jgi:branched-chain amino acid transport system substrate-binding protein